MIVVGIDPGPERSGVVALLVKPRQVLEAQIVSNEQLFEWLRRAEWNHLAIEKIESMGMPVGKSVFDTVFFTGMLYEHMMAFGVRPDYIHFMPRREVKLHLCNSSRAKDANIRQALLDKFSPSGGGSTPQVGTKAQPGPLHGIKSHLWSALALTVTFIETRANGNLS